MFISVIMPVYNGFNYLKSSVDSILQQTHSDFELIIIDDASKEPIWKILSSYNDPRLILKKNFRNLGLTRSLNICLDLAKGDIIVRHDGDDVAREDRFARELQFFQSGIGLVSCWAQAIDEQSKTIESDWEDIATRISGDEVLKQLPSRNCIVSPGAMFSREVFKRIGYFDEIVRYAQDYNYWLRLSEFFKIDIAPEVLILKRTHEQNAWKREDYTDWVKLARDRASYIKIIKKIKL